MSVRIASTRPLLCRLTTSLCAAAVFAMPVCAQADVLVINASGPSASEYPRGTKLADDARITLKRGDRMTVLDDGGTRILAGPATIALSAASIANRDRAQRLMRSLRDTRPSRTGVVRRVASAPDGPVTVKEKRPDRLWFVDIYKPGTFCMVPDAGPQLFRAMTGEALRLRFDPAQGGEAKLVFVPAFATSAILPLPKPALRMSQSWIVSEENSDKMRTITLMTIADPEDNATAMAEALLNAGCEVQLGYFAETLSPEEPSENMQIPVAM